MPTFLTLLIAECLLLAIAWAAARSGAEGYGGSFASLLGNTQLVEP